MPRNLTRRVEVLFPVDAPVLRDKLRREVIEPPLADNAHAYDMRADGTYQRRTPAGGEPARGAQTEVLLRLSAQAPPEEPPGPPARTRGGPRRRPSSSRGRT